MSWQKASSLHVFDVGMASLDNAVLSAKHLSNDHGTPHAPNLRNRPHNKEIGHDDTLRRSKPNTATTMAQRTQDSYDGVTLHGGNLGSLVSYEERCTHADTPLVKAVALTLIKLAALKLNVVRLCWYRSKSSSVNLFSVAFFQTSCNSGRACNRFRSRRGPGPIGSRPATFQLFLGPVAQRRSAGARCSCPSKATGLCVFLGCCVPVLFAVCAPTIQSGLRRPPVVPATQSRVVVGDPFWPPWAARCRKRVVVEARPLTTCTICSQGSST